MSNGINPNEHNRINHTQLNKQKQGAAQDNTANEAPQAQPSQADRPTVDPDQMMRMLGQLGAANLSAGSIENVGVNNSLNAFLSNYSPDDHAKLYSTFETTFRNEFGIDASPHLVQEALDDYLIGFPVIQS